MSSDAEFRESAVDPAGGLPRDLPTGGASTPGEGSEEFSTRGGGEGGISKDSGRVLLRKGRAGLDWEARSVCWGASRGGARMWVLEVACLIKGGDWGLVIGAAGDRGEDLGRSL